MKVDIRGRNRYRVPDALKNHVFDKLPKLEKYALKVEAAHVVFTKQKIDETCEIVLTGKDMRLTAIEKTSAMQASFDASIANLQKQLARHHDRIKDHHKKGHQKTSDANQI